MRDVTDTVVPGGPGGGAGGEHVLGLHFGGPIAGGEPAGHELAATEIIGRLAKRHELTPPPR